MKKIYSLPIVFVLIVLMAQSCMDEFLELEPRTNRLEANSYVTENDAFLALISAYDPIAHQEALNFIPYQSDIFSDDTYTAGEPPSGGMVDKWQIMERSVMDAESPTCIRLWKRSYRGIYRANQFLNKEGGIEWKSDATRKRMIAEIKFLRAYYYYDLVRHFGWVPLVTDLVSSEEAREIKQSEPEEIFTYIAKDLLEAIEDLPETIEPQYYGRASKGAAQVLMARIYLHYTGFAVNELGASGTWTDGATVIDEALVTSALEEIITNGHYRLLDEYAEVHSWENENNEESIFEFQYSEKSNVSIWDDGLRYLNNGNTSCHIIAPRNPVGDTTIATGWSFGTVTWSLYNEFEAGDPRLQITIYNALDSLDTYTHGYHNTGYFNYKYMARSEYSATESAPVHNYPKNHIDMRYAEVLLILAELYLDDNNARATELFNLVRTRSMGESAGLASITLDDIYHERRVEFACEGLRYWDLLRRGLDYAKEKIDLSYIPDPSYPAPDELAGYYFDIGHKGMLPIPEEEIRNANEGVLEQKIDFYR